MINIFNEVKKRTTPIWAKFINIGDKVQGTYVGKIVGVKDGYGKEQIVYQLLQEDDKIINVGFGLNKKVLNQLMLEVRFGQIIGFEYIGNITIKNRTTEAKDFSLYESPRIVNEIWLKKNENNMPEIIVIPQESDSVECSEKNINTEDVPF